MSAQDQQPQPPRGIHSDIANVYWLDDGREFVRARFRIESTGEPPFPSGDWLSVTVCARVYNPIEVGQRGYIGSRPPLAQGPEVPATARTEWSVVDLELPRMPPGEYVVVAKVYSRDEQYRRDFEPSNCFASVVPIGPPPPS